MKKWTETLLRKEAMKYTTRTEFIRNTGAAFRAAKRLGIYDDICKHMVIIHKTHTKKSLIKEGLKYKNKSYYMKYAPNSYAIARKLGILKVVCNHMVTRHIWTQKEIEQIANRYTILSAFIDNEYPAYIGARRLGILSLVTAHMMRKKGGKGTQSNVLYIWEALGEQWDDKPIFKIGVTSNHLGTYRIKKVAYTHNFDYKIHLFKVINNATVKEAELLNKFKIIPNLHGAGSTEFRAFSYCELQELLDALK